MIRIEGIVNPCVFRNKSAGRPSDGTGTSSIWSSSDTVPMMVPSRVLMLEKTMGVAGSCSSVDCGDGNNLESVVELATAGFEWGIERLSDLDLDLDLGLLWDKTVGLDGREGKSSSG